ncbi:MAG: phosphoribosyltransferase [Candidatus Levybacteria bacterium]|nr:phosphoribosyltransferase [Candidatus Levybacteria bacterium]
MFEDRNKAGAQLAEQLKEYKGDSIVLALPRGGVVIGFEIAKALKVPLDVIVVRKIGAPHNPELGIGAVSESNTKVLDGSAIKLLGIPRRVISEMIRREKEELRRRVAVYRNNKPLKTLKNRTVIIVDDGLATGATARAAIRAVKKHKPKQLIFAAPVCESNTARGIEHLVDKILCIEAPSNFAAVGQWYRNFEQVSDEEVVALLKLYKNPKV